MPVNTISTSLRAGQHNAQKDLAVLSLARANSMLTTATEELLKLALYSAEDPDLLMDARYLQEFKKSVRQERNRINDQIDRINLVVDALHASDQVKIDAAIAEMKTTHSVSYDDKFPALVIDVE